MTKEERIERYGIEEYERQKELSRIRTRKWREDNLEKARANERRYQQEHKQEKAEYDKNYRAEHKEEKRLKDKLYREKNKSKIRKQKHKRFQKEYHTKEGRAKFLKKSYDRYDTLNNLDNSNNVTADWILENIFTSKCVYCGEDNWERLGCDRIDNTKPHTADNIVCACGICNMERAYHYTVDEFVEVRKQRPRFSKSVAPPLRKGTDGALLKRV